MNEDNKLFYLNEEARQRALRKLIDCANRAVEESFPISERNIAPRLSRDGGIMIEISVLPPDRGNGKSWIRNEEADKAKGTKQ